MPIFRHQIENKTETRYEKNRNSLERSFSSLVLYRWKASIQRFKRLMPESEIHSFDIEYGGGGGVQKGIVFGRNSGIK